MEAVLSNFQILFQAFMLPKNTKICSSIYNFNSVDVDDNDCAPLTFVVFNNYDQVKIIK